MPQIRMTDTAPVLRHADGMAKVSMMRWAWPGSRGPVFNFRSDGRDFSASDRVLIPADAFYEFTAPRAGQTRKTRWRFTYPQSPLFFIAGVVQQGCFSMLTTAPGDDVRPYHDRQVVVLAADEGRDWLDLTRPQADILRAAPGGTLAVERDFPPADLFE